ncbi:hypothetical protein [Catenovulum sediminis]|uniref:Uncharacterized protein n=1 Tax=Catenovulum sediminis TaxID=1740262 RepID=A0ABV1RDY2_9ALTE|nr:hypothetical protein [Catenovulum sediminis]
MFRSVLVVLMALFSTQLLAHPDHAMEGTAHAVYHAVFWLLFAAVVVKGISFWRSRRVKNESNKKQG